MSIMRNKSQDELPSARKRVGDVLAKLARFTPDFMAAGRGQNQEAERKNQCRSWHHDTSGK